MMSVSPAGHRVLPSTVLSDFATVAASAQLCARQAKFVPSSKTWRTVHDGPSTGSGSVCGKRSRSNSSSSSESDDSAYCDSLGSSTNSILTNDVVDSPATSLSGLSPQDSADEDAERLQSSPNAGKRKALRRCWRGSPSSSARSPTSAAAQSSREAHVSKNSSPESTNRVSTPSSENDLASASLKNELSPRKNDLVDHLVDAAVATIEAIWNPAPAHGQVRGATPPCTASALPLPLFIRETLRRSRTSCSTLQAALLYCLRCAPAVRQQRAEFQQMSLSQRSDAVARDVTDQSGMTHPLLCGRRIFLASVMVASKFLQDKTFSNKGWNRMTGLPLRQLACVERAFLKAIGWDLNIRKGEWEGWVEKLAPAHMEVSRVQRFSEEKQLRSGSLTPTALHVRPRSSLVRIHSDDGPLNAFDASLSANSTPDRRAAQVQTDGASAAATVVAAACSSGSQSSTARRDSPAFDASLNAQTINAAATNMARPFPMPRAFVRSSHSFSSTANRLTAMNISAMSHVGAGSDSGQQPQS